MSEALQILKTRKINFKYAEEQKYFAKLFTEKFCDLPDSSTSYTITGDQFLNDFYIYGIYGKSEKIDASNFIDYLNYVGFKSRFEYECRDAPSQHGATSFERITTGISIEW